MTAAQLRDSLAVLGMSANDLGRFLDVDMRRTRRWVADSEPVPFWASALLWVMVSERLTPHRVMEIVEAMSS